MNELSIRLSVLNSKTFATKVIADIVSNGSKIKTYEQRLFNQISQPNIKRMAEDIKKLIDTNLKQGLKYTGGKVAPLAEATIEAKKRKGRRQPDRVFLDSGILFQSLRLVPIAKGYAVTFKKIKYPKSKLSVMEVAQWLNDGTPKMPARPFFGITELQLNKIISRHASARRITVEPTPRQVEQAGRAIKLITGFDPLKVQVIKSEGLKAATVQTEKLAVQEVVTTAPKVAEFIPAKTIEEAKERLTKQFIIERDAEELKWLDPDFIKPAVNIDLLSVEGANILLEVLEKENLIRPIKVKMISVKQMANTELGYYAEQTKELAFSPKGLNNKSRVAEPRKKLSVLRKEAEDKILEFEGYVNKPGYNQKKVDQGLRAFKQRLDTIDKLEKQGLTQTRYFSVKDSLSNDLDKKRALITHELAHYRYYTGGYESKFRFDINNSISDYGVTNKSEYFAEWYVQYKFKGAKDVPEDLLKLFKEIDNAN